MDIEYSEHAAKALLRMDRATQEVFIRHIEKMAEVPPGKHLKFGLLYNVEKVGQGRIIYQMESGNLFITRCFTTHKEYEKWYKSLR